MTNKQDAITLALEALKTCTRPSYVPITQYYFDVLAVNRAIAALTALEAEKQSDDSNVIEGMS